MCFPSFVFFLPLGGLILLARLLGKARQGELPKKSRKCFYIDTSPMSWGVGAAPCQTLVIETFRKSVCWPFGGGEGQLQGGWGVYMSYVMKFSWLTLFLKPAKKSKNIVLPLWGAQGSIERGCVDTGPHEVSGKFCPWNLWKITLVLLATLRRSWTQVLLRLLAGFVVEACWNQWKTGMCYPTWVRQGSAWKGDARSQVLCHEVPGRICY